MDAALLELRHFNPRSPCGERLVLKRRERGTAENFNPRSPCGERREARRSRLPLIIFQSTLPVRGATFSQASQFSAVQISIHAPRAGSDC